MGNIAHCCSTTAIDQHRGSVLDQHCLRSETNEKHTVSVSCLQQSVCFLFCQLNISGGELGFRLWGVPPKMPTDSHLCLSPFLTGDPDAAQACSQLLAATSPSPVILLALRCLVTPTDPGNSSTDPSSIPPQEPQGTMPAHAVAPLSSNAQTQSPEQEKQALIIQMTTHAALRPLTAHVPDSKASISGSHICSAARTESNSQSESGACQLCGNLDGVDLGDAVQGGITSDVKATAPIAAAHFACYVLTAPQLLRQLPAASCKLLTQQSTLMSLMSALQQISASNGSSRTPNGKASLDRGNSLASSGRSWKVPLPGTVSKGNHLGGIRLDGALGALMALGNLAGLLAGERITKAAQVYALPVCKALLSLRVMATAL